MFIQGDLQAVFDALYSVGAIDPVLKMDWSSITNEAAKNQRQLQEAIRDINNCRGQRENLILKMNGLEPKILNFIAVEVAREFAEFTSRSELH